MKYALHYLLECDNSVVVNYLQFPHKQRSRLAFAVAEVIELARHLPDFVVGHERTEQNYIYSAPTCPACEENYSSGL